MKSTSLSKSIDRALELFNVNNVLDRLENSDQALRARLILEGELRGQMEALITVESVERAFQLTRKANVNREIVDMLGISVERFNEGIGEALFLLLLMSATQGGQAALNRLGVDEEFELEDESQVASRVEDLLPALTVTSLAFLAAKIEEAKVDLLTSVEAVEFIRREIGVAAANRAETIIKTEIANVVGITEFNVFRNAGVDALKWITVMDERVCPICAPMEGQVRNMGGSFIGGDGSTAQHPPIHIRCRCFLEPV